jgi:hypothetical protein
MEGKIGKVSIMTLDGGARSVDVDGHAIAVNVSKPLATDNEIVLGHTAEGEVTLNGQYGNTAIESILPVGEIYVSVDQVVKVVHHPE